MSSMIRPETIKEPRDLKALDVAELAEFADLCRTFIVDNVSRTGGHIGANLGTVDLSVALHYVFDSPRERFIWDTGHQGYTHKIITGRAGLFPSLNTYGGMNRFVTRTESEHDPIEASHAGTSISVALGIALAKRLEGSQDHTIAVIGDGALVEGLAFEGLNHAAVERGAGLVVVLNDNGYAISPGFGAVHDYLQTLRLGEPTEERLFTSLGLDYIGPVDGHDMGQLVAALRQARESAKVPIVHVKTIKGYGLPAADNHPVRMHFSFPFDKETGALRDTLLEGYQDVAARVIGDEMARNRRVVAITPSTLYATGLQPIFDRFPDRCFDPGMEEQHAMSMTVGLALESYHPVIFYQSTFLQRAFDQLVHDVCFANLPVLILTVRTGFAGYDNPTHHGVFDFAYLRGLPNLTVLYPKDRYELERMVRDELRSATGPTIVAMPYGPVDAFDAAVLNESPDSFALPQVVESGDDVLLVAVGHRFAAARDAVKLLGEQGIGAGLVNLRKLKPLPEEALVALLRNVPRVAVVEEAVLDGGVGGAIAALASDHELDCRILRIGVPCAFIEAGSNVELTRKYELDAAGIATRVRRRWFS